MDYIEIMTFILIFALGFLIGRIFTRIEVGLKYQKHFGNKKKRK